ncbi:MAG TPA: AraC family transcriptional regulator, partial [Puia sp.]|nr:AraC family transcriptional regulator [Puia sp.]
AFCKYFKMRTKKTFSFFLNEVKVSYACRLLAEGNLNVLQICYESGYNNLSNFNRQFKRITKMTPTAYIFGQSFK